MPYPKEENAGEKAMGKLFEGMGGDMPPKKEPMADDEEGEELPPAFTAAAEEFLDTSLPADARMHALKRAIEACVDARESY